MIRMIGLLVVIAALSACATATEESPPALPTENLGAAVTATGPAGVLPTKSVSLSTVPAPMDNFFTEMGLTLQVPTACSLTPSQAEGPYYTADTPERHSLIEEGMPGVRLILLGYVLDQNCQPIPNAWLDFWQAGADGEYDNSGYRLRGHQFTDEQGRYHLETVVPAEYASRPIEHIHVKVQAPGGEVVTSQLYFPQQPVDGLTVTLEERGDQLVGYFNFVVPR